jgi:hypothetical protein
MPDVDNILHRSDEIATILNERARRISRDLLAFCKHVDAQASVVRFDGLHGIHLRAVADGDYNAANEALIQIHKCSFELARDESWAAMKAERDDNMPIPQLAIDAFTRGRMICMYIVGDMMSDSPNYPSSGQMIDDLQDCSDDYRRILGLPVDKSEPVEVSNTSPDRQHDQTSDLAVGGGGGGFCLRHHRSASGRRPVSRLDRSAAHMALIEKMLQIGKEPASL